MNFRERDQLPNESIKLFDSLGSKRVVTILRTNFYYEMHFETIRFKLFFLSYIKTE